ncbi:DUF2288 domain-containing protein [Geminocystis sp.]|uniref:DUF2288 domain-containing protein n=1 Tax=Geminocystis sp. TaxID=2664100 RepID=UPI0035945696
MSDLKTQLKEQIAPMDWQDLVTHAQRDVLIVVDSNLDLIEVGCAIAKDKTSLVQNWISEQLIQKPSPQQLSLWNQNQNYKFNTIIVQPYVLISPCFEE